MRVRTAIAMSKNMVSIRLLQSIGTQYAQEYITRFGFEAEKHPPYLTMALGAGSVTPWQMARAYGVFANGGFLVEPFIIDRIVDDRGNLLAQAQPKTAGDETLRVLNARNAFVMDSLMHEVVRAGTATRAMSLKRQDLAGKTGTTNDHVDAWFAGYQPTLVGIAWIGFDQPKKLGANETGGAAALPIWINYMQTALKGVPELAMRMPEGVVAVRIDPETGLRNDDGKLTEFFFAENVPPVGFGDGTASGGGTRSADEVRSQLF
jgi:penicillin-binding protein 1A